MIVSSEDLVSSIADSPIAVYESTLYLLVEKDAPNRKLISLDLDHPDVAHATVLVPASDAVLIDVYAAKDGLYLASKRGVVFEVRRSPYGSHLKWEKIPLPYDGTISSVDANVLLPGVIFGLESWTNPDQRFAYAPTSNRVSNTALIQKYPGDLTGFEAREVNATSADGTKVPLSILCKKGLALDGSHPALYEGYGAYGISYDPYFDPRIVAWIERGACSLSRTCEAAESSGNPGTTPGARRPSNTPSMTWLLRHNTLPRSAIPRPNISRCVAPVRGHRSRRCHRAASRAIRCRY